MNKLTIKGQLIFCFMLLAIGFLIAMVFLKKPVINLRLDLSDKTMIVENILDFDKPIVFK